MSLQKQTVRQTVWRTFILKHPIMVLNLNKIKGKEFKYFPVSEVSMETEFLKNIKSPSHAA